MKIENTFYGKIATSQLPLRQGFIVELSTMKRSGGETSSTFTLYKIISENTRETAFYFKPFSINHGKQLRLTEKKLKELHLEALKTFNNKDWNDELDKFNIN